jgi:hypothetical protein
LGWLVEALAAGVAADATVAAPKLARIVPPMTSGAMIFLFISLL